jgi:hypothetical protein
VSLEPTHLQPGQGLLGDGHLDLIQHRLIRPGQPQASEVPRGGAGADGRAAECADCRDDGRPGQGDLPQLRSGASAGNQVGDHLRPVQARDLLGDVPGIQQPGRPPAGVAVPGAQVQQGDQQRQLVGGGTAAGVDDLQQPLGKPRAGAARTRLVRCRR